MIRRMTSTKDTIGTCMCCQLSRFIFPMSKFLCTDLTYFSKTNTRSTTPKKITGDISSDISGDISAGEFFFYVSISSFLRRNHECQSQPKKISGEISPEKFHRTHVCRFLRSKKKKNDSYHLHYRPNYHARVHLRTIPALIRTYAHTVTAHALAETYEKDIA